MNLNESCHCGSRIELRGESYEITDALKEWRAQHYGHGPKAEGSTVGQCGDAIQAIGEPRLVCHLAYGHVGEHSNGGATWTNIDRSGT